MYIYIYVPCMEMYMFIFSGKSMFFDEIYRVGYPRKEP